MKRCFHHHIITVSLLVAFICPAFSQSINFNKVAVPEEATNAVITIISQDRKGNIWCSLGGNGACKMTNAKEIVKVYHGLHAKDKSFNANMPTHFNESTGKINIISQANGYDPTVTISTKKMPNKVEIIVKDNGNGIPQKVIEKIFQPFFTTKPTGQGTGLGLSLSYDIVKAHGGEIKVESHEGEGTEFIVQLPY